VTGAKVADGSLAAADVGVLVGAVSHDPASLAANTCAAQTATVTGMAAGDRVILNPDEALENGLILQPAVATTANQMRLRLCNSTDGAVDGAPRTHSYIVIR